MKKWLSFFIIAAMCITTALRFVRDSSFMNENWTDTLVSKTTEEVDLNEFLERYSNEEFEQIHLKDVVKMEWYVPYTGAIEARGFMKPKADKLYTVYKTNKPADTSLPELGISLTWSTIVDVKFNEQWLVSKLLLEQVLPLVFFIFILILAFKFFGPKGWGMPGFGIKAWKLRTNKDIQTKFGDVAWMDEVKDELIEVVDFLKNPKKYQKVGAKIPRWVLLWGPPGSWKTLLAKAVAGEAGVPFFSASWSEFMEMLVGMWAAKVRELFKKAKAASPAIIFIDEIDTIWRKRWGGYSWGHQEQEQTLNQILTEMDGFDTNSNVIVIAATNRPDTLDSALMRSWRFDRKIMVGNPTLDERKLILDIHAKGKQLATNADLDALARRTSGFVGADLANILNEAALKIAKDNRKKITMEDLDYALEKIVMGPEKKIKTLKEKERKIITYHELGHAVTAYFSPEALPVEKISIVSRGMAMWVTRYNQKEDTYLYSKARFKDDMVATLWWRAAEEIFFWKDHITTGASNDFEKVTKSATDMILKYWMDEELWTLIRYDQTKADYQQFKPMSNKTIELADKKIKALVDEAYKKALAIIKKNKKLMDKLAWLLLEKEYLNKDEFLTIMDDPKNIDAHIETFSAQHKKTVKKLAAKKVPEKKKQSKAPAKKAETPTQKEIEDKVDEFLKK